VGAAGGDHQEGSLVHVAVLGAGAGGLAVAYEWASGGNDVSLYSDEDHAQEVRAVRTRGGIHAEGVIEGFAPVTATTDIAEALDDADAVFVVTPAYATEVIARQARDHLRSGMTVVVCPASCVGSLAFKTAAGLDLFDETVLVGETSTLPYAVRAADGVARVFHRFDRSLYVAAAPRTGTAKVLELVRQAYPHAEEAAGIFQTTLQNGNPVIHPAVTLLNAALIERTAGDFMFYEQGVTPATGHLMEAVDQERMAVASALGVTILSEPEIGVQQGYMREVNYTTGYSTAPGFRGIKAQPELDHRYLTEDVGYSLVFVTDLAHHLGVPTPVMNAVVEIASVVLRRDFRGEGARTMAGMGLTGLTREQLATY
jgi:opine dehydrogenase